eukprot:1671192-Rhodomonas_salina.5
MDDVARPARGAGGASACRAALSVSAVLFVADQALFAAPRLSAVSYNGNECHNEHGSQDLERMCKTANILGSPFRGTKS